MSYLNSTQNNDKILVEVHGKDTNVKRDYKLSSKTKFKHFSYYFSSELRSCDLLHVIQSNNNTIKIDVATKKQNDFQV